MSAERQRVAFVTERISRGWTRDGATMVATALHPLDGPAPTHLEKQIRKRSKALQRATPRDEEHAVELARVALIDYAALARTSQAWEYAEIWSEASELVELAPPEPTDDPEAGAADDATDIEIVDDEPDADGAEGPTAAADETEIVDIMLASDETEIVIDIDSGTIEAIVPEAAVTRTDERDRPSYGEDTPVRPSTLARIASTYDDIDDLYDASTKAHAIALLGSSVVEAVGEAIVTTEAGAGARDGHPDPDLIFLACTSAFRVGYATAAIALGLDAPLQSDDVQVTTSTDRAAATLFLERLAPADGLGWFPALGSSVELIIENSARHLATTLYVESVATSSAASTSFIEAACHRCGRLGFALAVIEHDLTTDDVWS